MLACTEGVGWPLVARALIHEIRYGLNLHRVSTVSCLGEWESKEEERVGGWVGGWEREREARSARERERAREGTGEGAGEGAGAGESDRRKQTCQLDSRTSKFQQGVSRQSPYSSNNSEIRGLDLRFGV